MQNLFDIADSLGYSVEYTDLATRDGECRPDRRIIRLQRGMTRRHERSILGHELAHAVFEDGPTLFGPLHARQERRADEWCARTLISVEAYRAAEDAHDGHVPMMAFDLGVISRIVEAYQRTLVRIGDTVYRDAHLGRAGSRVELSA